MNDQSVWISLKPYTNIFQLPLGQEKTRMPFQLQWANLCGGSSAEPHRHKPEN